MMITERFVCLHYPKSGGTFVRAVLDKLCRQTGVHSLDHHDRLPKHGGVAAIPKEYRALPILCNVRSPYDLHVSHFEFEWWKSHPDDTFDFEKMRRKYRYFPDISFEEYLYSVYDFDLLCQNYADTRILRKFKQAELGLKTLDLAKFVQKSNKELIGEIEKFDADYLKQKSKDITFMRMDNLNEELYAALKRLKFPVSALEFIRHEGKIYPSGGRRDRARNWSEYYSEDMKKLVRTRERMIFDVFPEFDV